jgi:hypothetical protein
VEQIEEGRNECRSDMSILDLPEHCDCGHRRLQILNEVAGTALRGWTNTSADLTPEDGWNYGKSAPTHSESGHGPAPPLRPPVSA